MKIEWNMNKWDMRSWTYSFNLAIQQWCVLSFLHIRYFVRLLRCLKNWLLYPWYSSHVSHFLRSSNSQSDGLSRMGSKSNCESWMSLVMCIFNSIFYDEQKKHKHLAHWLHYNCKLIGSYIDILGVSNRITHRIVFLHRTLSFETRSVFDSFEILQHCV